MPAKVELAMESELGMATKPTSKIPVTEMMRLLHTKTLAFEEFPVSRVPDYAILSHRWLENEENEATFSDMLKVTDATKQKDGYKKIVSCCKQAASVGLDCKCQYLPAQAEKSKSPDR
jgi:hypothetical protein